MRAVRSTIAAAPALCVAVGALVLTACEKGETGGPGARPGPDPHGSAAQEWVARPPPLPSSSPYISDVVTPGCTDGQARFELWLSGWGGEAWATASVGSVNESIGLVQCFVDVCTCEGVGAVPPGNLADQAADAGMYG